MRSRIEIAKRCTCLEVLCQRVALEEQRGEIGASAQTMRDSLIAGVFAIDCADAFVGDEADILCAALGAISATDRDRVTTWSQETAVLLWCVSRLSDLPTVEELAGEALNDVLSRGFWASGDAKKITKAIASAKPRTQKEIEGELARVTRDASVAVSVNPDIAHTELPPVAVVQYVMPWILFEGWPWGKSHDITTPAPGITN
jgi:hypothetical protein